MEIRGIWRSINVAKVFNKSSADSNRNRGTR